MSTESLKIIACKEGLDITSTEFAKLMDEKDCLKNFKDNFVFPKVRNETSTIYFASNRRGLPTKQSKNLVTKVMEDWGRMGAKCYFGGTLPLVYSDQYIVDQMASLVGAEAGEVAAFNDVDTNMHLLLVSFYRPDENRHKFLVAEDCGFVNIAKSHIRKHGQNEEGSLLIARPKLEKALLETEDILEMIESEGNGICTILLPGTLLKSANVLDIKKITKSGHDKGCMVGFCIDNLVGDVELQLHNWEVDFACWDTGKYLGTGPCSVGGAFMHWKHTENNRPTLSGWWSHKLSTVFEMSNVLDKTPGISGYLISKPSPVKIAQLKASLDVYSKTNMTEIAKKSALLTAYLEQLIAIFTVESLKINDKIKSITTRDPSKRGSQINLRLDADASQVCGKLLKNGIVCSYIHPDILQVCLAPLLCHFEDILLFTRELVSIVSE